MNPGSILVKRIDNTLYDKMEALILIDYNCLGKTDNGMKICRFYSINTQEIHRSSLFWLKKYYRVLDHNEKITK